jgi:DNA-binding phage protein
VADEVIAYMGGPVRLQIRTDSKPADPEASNVGTLLVDITTPATPFEAQANGVIAKLGTWSGVAIAAGLARHYRIVSSDASEVFEQGTITKAITLLTTASTGVGSNVITVADTTGIEAGQGVSGAGAPSGATVLDVPSSTSVRMTAASTLGISSGGALTFGDTSGNLQLPSVDYEVGQTIVIDAKLLIVPGR